MIRGGDWPSTVAGECLTHFRLALYPGERVETLKAARRADRRGRRGEPPRARARSASRCSTTASSARATSSRPDAPLITGLSDACRARDRAGAAAVRVDRDDRRAHVPALRRHARGLLRAARRERARRRRARPPAVGHRDRAGDRAVHRRLVRRGVGAVRLTKSRARILQPAQLPARRPLRQPWGTMTTDLLRRPRGARPLRVRRGDGAAARRHRRRGRADRGRRRALLHRLRRRHRLPEPRARRARGRRARSTSRSTATCTSASWSACTSPTSRSAGGSPSSTPAAASTRACC